MNKNKLSVLFKNCLELLRNNEHIVGYNAFRTISSMLILKLIEPMIKKNIVDGEYQKGFELDFSFIPSTLVEAHKKNYANLCYIVIGIKNPTIRSYTI